MKIFQRIGIIAIMLLLMASCGNSKQGEKPLTAEELKAAGFRFLKENTEKKVKLMSDNKKYSITGAKYLDFSYSQCYGGHVSKDGLLNGVVIIKGGRDSYLAYICDGRIVYPVLSAWYYEGRPHISIEEGYRSYGCDGIGPTGVCASMREVYGIDLSDTNVINSIYEGTIDLARLEDTFKDYVKSGNSLDNDWTSDPKYTHIYEGLEPRIEGYKVGEYDEKEDEARPINNGVLIYSQPEEYYCDGKYDPDEPRNKNGHSLHTSYIELNPNHFRIIFSFKALSNMYDEQWPLIDHNKLLGVCLNSDNTITITTWTDNPRGKKFWYHDHYYVTGYSYSPHSYFDVDMEYDHGKFIFNNHRFNVSLDTTPSPYYYNFQSVDYSTGNAFKGWIKGLKIYSYPD